MGTGSSLDEKKLKSEKLSGEIIVHEFEVPKARRFKFIPKAPYPVVENNPDRYLNTSQIALTGMTENPMSNQSDEPSTVPAEGVKTEIGATPKKRKKKSKEIETPSRKKVKKSTSIKTE